MPLPLSTAREIVQAASGPCLISNESTTATMYLDKRSFVSWQAYTQTLPPGSSLQWGGGELWAACAPTQSTMYTIMYGANLSGASANATANAIYGTGSRLVDNPISVKYSVLEPNATGPQGMLKAITLNVADALSVDVIAFLSIDPAFPVAAGARLWATLTLTWLDSLGVAIDTDAFGLLIDRNTLNAGLTSRYIRIRTPAMGTSLTMSWAWDSARTAGRNDQIKLRVVMSSRTTDRVRVSPGSTPGYENMGILSDFAQVVIPGTGVSSPVIVEAFSGIAQVTLVCGTGSPATARLAIGSASDIQGSFYTVPMNAGQTIQLVLYLPRTHLLVSFVTGTAGVAAAAYLQVTASDT